MHMDVALAIMASIAHVDKHEFRFSRDPLCLFQGFSERISIVWISMRCPAANNRSSLGGGRQHNLATELVALVGFCLTDAFHRRGVNAVTIVLVVTFLFLEPLADIQQFIPLGVRIGIFSFNVTDDAAETGPQGPGTFSFSFHLPRVGTPTPLRSQLLGFAVVILCLGTPPVG